MDFRLTDEQRMIMDYGRRLGERFDRGYWMEHAERRAFPMELWQQLGADGFIGMTVPEEYGGAGAGMLDETLLTEAMSNAGIPLLQLVVGSTMSLSHIAMHGTEAQKRHYLPDACAGRKLFCFAITEADAGSNSMKIKTIATPQGPGKGNGNFRLNGSKTFITGVESSDYMLVVARTTPFEEVSRKTDGFTLFILDLKKPGIEKHRIDVSVAVPECQWQVFFDDVPLGPEDVIGEVGDGFRILFDLLNPERMVVAAQCVGLGRYALERAVEYASERVVFDRPIGAYQGLAHPLAAAKTEIEMAALMAQKAAWCFDNGEPAGEASNMAKYFGAEAAIRAVDAAVQCFGGNAFTKEYGIFDIYPYVRVMRTAPLNREIILSYIGEKVMGLPRSY